MIEAHVIGQFPKGKCIIQSPGTGNKDNVSIPFIHQFSYDSKQSQAFKERSVEDYNAVREFIINDRDPLLQQTYISIHLNDRPIYFHDLVANRTLIECPIGMAIYHSHVKQIEDTNELSEFNERCEVFFGWLCDGNGERIVHDGEYDGQPLYVKGQYAIDIVERAGYSYFYDYPLAEYLCLPFDPEKLYFVRPH